jgi:hypothetical protein
MLVLAQLLIVVIFTYKLFVVGLREKKPFCFYGFEVQQKRDPKLYWSLYFLSLILWVLFVLWIYFTVSQLQL